MGFIAVAMTTTVLGGAPVAGADSDDGAMCNFTLSDPKVVDVNGVAMVMAGVVPAACTGSASPSFVQVCVSAPGIVGRCIEKSGYSAPQAYLSPYVPGTTYTAQGRGCAATSTPPRSICTTVGPQSVTL
jgi:hypothetical protein